MAVLPVRCAAYWEPSANRRRSVAVVVVAVTDRRMEDAGARDIHMCCISATSDTRRHTGGCMDCATASAALFVSHQGHCFCVCAPVAACLPPVTLPCPFCLCRKSKIGNAPHPLPPLVFNKLTIMLSPKHFCSKRAKWLGIHDPMPAHTLLCLSVSLSPLLAMLLRNQGVPGAPIFFDCALGAAFPTWSCAIKSFHVICHVTSMPPRILSPTAPRESPFYNTNPSSNIRLRY